MGAIESSSQSTLEPSTTILSSKLVNQNKKPFNMSTIVANPVQPEATKIEKLEANLANFEESSEKEEKLRAKLRYLQFFENFQVATTPAHFVCSECKEVEVVRKEVLHLTHKEAPEVKTSYKKEVEVQCLSQETHKREWQEQEKEQKATVGKEGKLLHGDSCKTCVRMDKLMGQVLPHSPNC